MAEDAEWQVIETVEAPPPGEQARIVSEVLGRHPELRKADDDALRMDVIPGHGHGPDHLRFSVRLTPGEAP